MRKALLIIFAFITILSCKENSQEEPLSEAKVQLEPVIEGEQITSNFREWWVYYYNEITLSADFEPLDEHSNPISKEKFLQRLTTGNYIPIEMKTDRSRDTYQLFPLPQGSDENIGSTMKNAAITAYGFSKMEGKDFPNFEFRTLNGELYNNERLKGKTTLVKTWFIACKPCIEEMPLLNELVSRYAEDDKIQFLSLALDSEEELNNFLTKFDFDYAVAPDQKKLISDELGLNSYPTHIIINETGKIEKVFLRATEMILHLESSYATKSEKNKRLPPPPPPPPGS